MSTSIVNSVDEEMARYEEAALISANPPPVNPQNENTTVFNRFTGVNEVLLPLEAGGYVKIGEMPKDKTQDIVSYARTLESLNQPFDMENFITAGFSEDEVIAAGVVPEGQTKTGRSEPLSEGEQLQFIRSGQDIVLPRDMTLREQDREYMYLNEEGELREIFTALGIDQYTARRISEGIFGNENSTRDLGIGVAEFTPLGLFYGAEEGYNAYKRGINSGDNVGAVLGAVTAGLSVLEAIPMTAVGAKAAKKNIPLLRNALVELGQDASTRMADRASGTTLYSGMDPSLVVDPLLVSLGKAVAPKASDVTLGAASDIPKVSQLSPQYRVTLQGVQPGGTGKQSFVPKNMTPANFERTSTNLQTIADDFVDPLESQENYALMMGRVQNSTEVPAPPAWMIEHANDMDKWTNWFSGLTDDQIKAADEGLAVQDSFREAYASGASPELTGQLMLWSILSRRLSAYPHESGYIELAEAARPFIQKAARGEWTDADTAAWLEAVPNAIPAGTPGKSATSNANDFGAVFLKKMAATDENGVSALTRLHNMIADPNMSSAEIRRQYYGIAQDTGIKNKILSFALLVSGRNDVVVLDRIQINRMWGGGDKIYDDVYTQFDGAQGLAQYEALERSLQTRVSQLYENVGRGDVGSVGRYHWESWVLSSGQVVSHPTLDTVVRSGAPKPGANIPPTASTPVMEGRFHRFDSGVQYEKLPDGSNRYIYRTSDGEPFQFTKQSLNAMFDQVKKKSSGVLPDDFPGVQAFEGGSIPWYEYEGVDRGKFDAIIRGAGEPIE